VQPNNQYEIFLNDCFNLAETIIYKSDYLAQLLNKTYEYRRPAGFVPEDRRTWKYYMNLAGDYFSLDKPMYVQSVDTQETILFSKENLKIHRATRREYAYGQKLYYELLAKYPNQEELILGILYPTDYERSINAEDYSIISYAPDLVQAHEASLIERLETQIKRIVSRWHNGMYRLIDDHYDIVMLGIMSQLTVAFILKIRREFCKTNEAHTYHIRQYLASNMGLDRYFDVMTLKQQLWFYRNVRFINRNAGHNETFEDLIKNLMDERKLALTSFTMTHDVEKITTELAPKVLFKRSPKNKFVSSGFQEPVELDVVMQKEDEVARLNPQTRVMSQAAVQFKFENSLSNVEQTKILESAMFDYSDATPFPFSDVLINHWPYLAAQGIYRSFIRVVNPKTGEILPISVKDAFVFAQYLLLNSQGFALTEVQPVICRKVQLIPKPSTQDLLTMTSGHWFTEADAQDLLSYNPELTEIISTDAYWETAHQIFTALNYQRNKVAFQEHYVRRAEMQGMAARIYGATIVELEPEGTLYTDWFTARGIEIEDFPTESYGEIYTEIVKQALGLDTKVTPSLKNIQSAMVSMFSELSSYSIQFLTEINDSPIKIIDWPVVRFGDLVAQASGQSYYVDMAIDFFNRQTEATFKILYNVNDHVRITNQQASAEVQFDLTIPRQFLPQHTQTIITYRLESSKPRFSMQMPAQTLYPDGQVPVPGIDTSFRTLTEAQKRSLPDMYETQWWNNNPIV